MKVAHQNQIVVVVEDTITLDQAASFALLEVIAFLDLLHAHYAQVDFIPK